MSTPKRGIDSRECESVIDTANVSAEGARWSKIKGEDKGEIDF